MNKRRFLEMCCVGFALTFLITFPANGADVPPDFQFQASVEEYFEGRLADSLKDILGADPFIPVVYAEVGSRTLDSEKKNVEESGPSALPGVPVKKKLGMEGAEKGLSTVVRYIRRLAVTIYLDQDVPASKDDLIGEIVKDVTKFDARRGDAVSIKRIDLGTERFRMASLFVPPNLYWTVFAITAVLFLLVASFSFMNPLRKLLTALGDVNWTAFQGGGRGGSEGPGPTIETHNVFQTTPSAQEKVSSVDGETPMPFAFLEQRHLGNLAYLCRSRPDREVGIIASYLSPELMTEFLEYFEAERQVGVAVELARTHELSPEDVRALEEDLKTRLDYLVGGESKVLSIMDRTSDEVRERILTTLRERDGQIAEQLGRKVKSFESVLADLPAEAIQIVNRRVDPVIFAQLLKTVPEDIRGKVLESVSSGVAERLRQEMEMSRPLSPVRVSREKKNMVALVRRLITEGIIEEA